MSVNLRGKIIKHDKAMDVMFDVMQVIWTPTRLKLKGAWLNMGFVDAGRNWIIPASGKQDGRYIVHIEIAHEDLKNWKFCGTPQAKCLRYEKWLKI